MRFITVPFALALGALPLSREAAPAAPNLVIDPGRSIVRFTVTKLGFADVTGTFLESSGDVSYDAARPDASLIRWRVGVASVRTDAADRDRSLQSADYFDARRCPDLSFESRRVQPRSDGTLSVTGDITIRCRTRPITVTVRPRPGSPGPVFVADFTLDRYDFDVAGGLIMGRLIGREVRVHVEAATEPAPSRRHR